MTRVYRAVKSNPPTETDFLSNRDKGLAPTPPEIRDPRLHIGVSAWIVRGKAESKARQFNQGYYLAEITIQDGAADIRVEDTGNDPEHRTVIGDSPATILAYVSRVFWIKQ